VSTVRDSGIVYGGDRRKRRRGRRRRRRRREPPVGHSRRQASLQCRTSPANVPGFSKTRYRVAYNEHDIDDDDDNDDDDDDDDGDGNNDNNGGDDNGNNKPVTKT